MLLLRLALYTIQLRCAIREFKALYTLCIHAIHMPALQLVVV